MPEGFPGIASFGKSACRQLGRKKLAEQYERSLGRFWELFPSSGESTGPNKPPEEGVQKAGSKRSGPESPGGDGKQLEGAQRVSPVVRRDGKGLRIAQKSRTEAGKLSDSSAKPRGGVS